MALSYECGELPGYPREEWPGNGMFIGIRQLMCNWDDRYDLLTELDSEPNRLYPYLEAINAYPVAARIEPFGVPEEDATTYRTGKYALAVLTVTYRNNAPAIHKNILISEEFYTTGQNEPVPHELLQWTDGTELESYEAPTRWASGFDWTVTFHRVMGVPGAADTMVDYTNNATVVSPTYSRAFPAHTLVYRGYALYHSVGWGKMPWYKLQYRFSWHPFGANKHWRPETGQYEALEVKSTGQPYINYPLGSFVALGMDF